MKKILTFLMVVGVAGLVFGGQLTTQLKGTTSAVGYNSTNTYTTETVMPLGNAEALLLVVKFKSAATNSETQTLTVSVSPDKENWITYKTIEVAANGTTQVVLTTNLTSLGAWPFLNVSRWVNPNTGTNSYITNIYVGGWTKLH